MERSKITLKNWNVGNYSINNLGAGHPIGLGTQYIKYVSTPYSREHIAIVAWLKARPDEDGALAENSEDIDKTKEIARLIAHAPVMKTLLEEELKFLSGLMIGISGLHETGIRTRDAITKRKDVILKTLDKLK